MEAKRRGLISTSFLNSMVMNYLIVQGCQAAAEQFELEVGTYLFYVRSAFYFEQFVYQIARV